VGTLAVAFRWSTNNGPGGTPCGRLSALTSLAFSSILRYTLIRACLFTHCRGGGGDDGWWGRLRRPDFLRVCCLAIIMDRLRRPDFLRVCCLAIVWTACAARCLSTYCLSGCWMSRFAPPVLSPKGLHPCPVPNAPTETPTKLPLQQPTQPTHLILSQQPHAFLPQTPSLC